MMPPPITTTSAVAGSLASLSTVSTGGDIPCDPPLPRESRQSRSSGSIGDASTPIRVLERSGHDKAIWFDYSGVIGGLDGGNGRVRASTARGAEFVQYSASAAACRPLCLARTGTRATSRLDPSADGVRDRRDRCSAAAGGGARRSTSRDHARGLPASHSFRDLERVQPRIGGRPRLRPAARLAG